MPHFDQSTWLAYRVQSAQEMGPPDPPKHVALPGARVAIPHEYLLAHQSLGRGEVEVVSRVNEKWRQEAAQRLSEHAEWVSGPYADAIAEMRRKAAEKTAEDMRKRAFLDEILSEREEADAGES